MEMQQLKSHLRAGRHKCQLYFKFHVRFLSCVISLIVLLVLPSPSSAVLLRVPNFICKLIEGYINISQKAHCVLVCFVGKGWLPTYTGNIR